MSQELQDFHHFKDNQLVHFDRDTGQLDVKANNGQTYQDVGSKNEDGYVRMWTNGHLRMKHRLIHFLVHNKLPDSGHEIDHRNNIRDDNRPSNIHEVPKAINNTGCSNRKFGSQFSEETVIEICELLANTTLSDLTIAERTGASRGTIRDIKTRRSRVYASKNYQWPHRVKESSTTIETIP